MEVIYSKDDEGNGYGHVHYEMGLGNLDEYGEFEAGGVDRYVCIN